jgi:hypothetical protein
MDEQKLESEIAAQATGPRVTLQKIESEIVTENTFRLGDALRALGQKATDDADLTTVVALTTKLGFVVIGTSACVAKENYSAEIGHKVARQKAIDQLWPLEGYRLKADLERSQS